VYSRFQSSASQTFSRVHTYTHTHTYIHTYTHTYIHVSHQMLRGATLEARVLASNSLFSSEATNSTRVRVIGLPSAPTLISTRETLDGDINVSWAAPSDTGYADQTIAVLTMYQIDVSLCVTETCKTTFKRIPSTDADFASRTTLVRADSLPETAVVYSITVQALNALGWSLPSNTLQQDYK
jgi:hypothetical protein